jgi:hypothetical protein
MGLNQKIADEELKLQRQDQFHGGIEGEGIVFDYKDDYEEGDVTGFMVEKPIQSSGINSEDVSAFISFFLLIIHSIGNTKLILLLQFSCSSNFQCHLKHLLELRQVKVLFCREILSVSGTFFKSFLLENSWLFLSFSITFLHLKCRQTSCERRSSCLSIFFS